jgi:hypothetical protein
MQEKIKKFAELVQAEQLARLRIFDPKHPMMSDDEFLSLYGMHVRIKPGRKYTKLDFEHTGKFMIETATGCIFGVKGYGKVHRGHCYGTLDTVGDWRWGEFTPVHAPPAKQADLAID